MQLLTPTEEKMWEKTPSLNHITMSDQEINDKLKASSDNSSFDTAKDFKLYREDEDPKHEDYEKGLQTPRLLLSL